MERTIKPTKVTGGGGFSFEDKVAVYFLSCILAERPPIAPEFGIASRVDFQVGVDGWLLDDILVTLISDDKKSHCAFSIKSNPQFSKTTAPHDFVKNAWEQYFNEDDSPFKKNCDRLGIITSSLDSNTKIRLDDLLNKARSQRSTDLAKRIKVKGYVSKEKMSLFESFACPEEISKKHGADENNIGEFLSCIEHLQFDFENPSSSNKNEAITILKTILESGSHEDAINLWDSLCSIANKAKINGGYIDKISLVAKLRANHSLKGFPHHAQYWKEIRQLTEDELSCISATIADKVSLSRDKEISDLQEKLKETNIVVLLGASGSGKTVIGKKFAEANFKFHKVVWINAENLSELDQIPVRELFKSIPDREAFLVLDGLDRIFDKVQFKKIALILKSCLEGIENASWKIVLSCQPEEWGRVQTNLSQLNLDTGKWERLDIKNPTHEDLQPVWEAYPALKNLTFHKHLRQFIHKPKILDLFARKLETGATIDTQSWKGESHLITWFWESEIDTSRNGLARSSILKRAAEKMANNLTTELPETEFASDELSTIEELIRDRYLKKQRGKILFNHDLVADWARQRILLDKYPDIHDFLRDKLISPIWCKALRLLGIHFLESEPNMDKWKRLFDSFGENEDRPSIGKDLLLEASIFSANPVDNLERLWSNLINRDGCWLKRLLKRFLISTTFPTMLALAVASKYKDEPTSGITTLYRDPYHIYWIPVIQFLYKHKKDVIKVSGKQVAEIVNKWLRFSKINWPARKESAEIAVEIAENLLAFKMSKDSYLVDDDIDKIAFNAGLAACYEEPERSTNFALTACSRKEPSGRILDLITKNNKELDLLAKDRKQPRRIIPKPLASIFESEIRPPWPDGPQDRVDNVFQDICLNGDALYPLIASSPDVAIEIILALLIEHPSPRERFDNGLREYSGLSYMHSWFPPFFTRGPFYFFFNTHPDKGLDLILTLINFATDRWADKWTKKNEEPPNIEFEFSWGKKKYVGDADIYYWHRNAGRVSDIIPSALMALEKWLYTQLEKDDLKEEAIKNINYLLKHSSSLAFIGLVITLGKKYPEIFDNNLLSLLAVPEIYSWDIEHIIKSENHQMIGWLNEGEDMVKMAHDFHSMPHRKCQISKIALNLFINEEEARKSFNEFRNKWLKRLESGNFGTVSPESLENIVQWFDLSNWQRIKHHEHGEILEFQMPQEIAEKRESASKDLQDRGKLIQLPIYFRRVLSGEEKISADQAQEIWENIEYVSSIPISEQEDDFNVLSKENVICGGIAVLVIHFREWLRNNPEQEKWCIENITNLIFNPPPSTEYEYEGSTAPWKWDRFCSEAMPVLWAEEPGNYSYRRCIAILASNVNYEAVGILFTSVSKLRVSLKGDFLQLQNFLVRWSHIRWKLRQERYSEKKTFDYMQWLDKEIDTFANGKTSKEQLDWAVLAKDEIQHKKDLLKKTKRKEGIFCDIPNDPCLDLWLIKAAYSWLPQLKDAIDNDEREQWLNFWKQALTWTVSLLEVDDNEEICGTPSDWDSWVLERVADQILYLEERERPDELWKPILELGSEGHYWVENFIRDWFFNGLASETIPANFVKLWKEMLEHALKSDKWNRSKGYRGFYVYSLWCDLLGMNYLVKSIWGKDKKVIIGQMKKYYTLWANEFLTDTDSAVKFINFLERPAAIEILLEGFVWLDNASTKVGASYFISRDKIQDHLVNLLEISWRKNKSIIKGNDSAYKAFNSLLGKLLDLQNPQAIELQQNLLST